MANVAHSIARILVKGRYGWSLLALMLTGVLLYFAVDINFNFSPESIYIDDDPAYTFYETTYLKQFAHVGTPCMVAVRAEDAQAALKQIEEKLVKNPYVTQVVSPFTQPVIVPTEQGIKVTPAVDEQGKLTETARSYFNQHPLYQKSFLGTDPRVMALVFMPELKFQDQDWHKKVVESIEGDVADLKKAMPGVEIYLTGLPIIQHEMVSLLQRDQLIFMPILTLFLLVLLMVMTRHVFGALFPMLIIVLALVWTVGYLDIIDHDINVVNNAIFILIMVIGIADAVHIYTRFHDEALLAQKSKVQPHKETILIKTMSAMVVPCFLTSFTTALGFFASSAAGVSIIKQFGLDAALGVMFCFVITMMVMPTLLSFHPLPKKTAGKEPPKKYGVDSILRYSLGKSLRFAKPLSIASIVVIALCLYLGRNVESNQTWVGELPPSNKAIRALSMIEENFAGVMPFYVVFSGDPARLASFDNAKAISSLATKLRNHELKPTVRSPIDPINFLLEHNPAPLMLSEIDEDTYQELVQALMQGGGNLDVFWSPDKRHVRVQGFLANTSTNITERFRLDLENMVREINIPGVKVNATGPLLIGSRALHNLTHDMASSILLAIAYIAIFMALFFRSIRYSLIALMPNILPIVLTIAFMDIANIDVRLATVMIFSMALGLSIDTCIHLICRVMEETARPLEKYKKLSFMRSLFRAFHGSGRPIIYTTIILLGGFSVMMFSRFLALRDFAYISALVLLSALISDIILLPALLFIFRPRAKG